MNKPHTAVTPKDHLDFLPLRAWRYNTERVEMATVLAPPYDVISPEKQDKLYERSAFNCVRLILNKKEPSDNDTNNSYTRARDLFQNWQKTGILIREDEASFYVYRQTFKDPVGGTQKSRYALLGRVRLEPFEKGVIIPHEKTLRGPREDRMKLLRAVQTNFSPVFGLYKDDGYEVRSLIHDPMNSRVLFEAEDSVNIVHSLWVIQDADILMKLQDVLKRKRVYIADGHHRYETALEYAKQKRQETHASDNVIFPYDCMYMALVSFDDPGFIVLPTHRIVSELGMDNQEMKRRLGEYFTIESVSLSTLETMTTEPDDLGKTFGLVLKDGAFLLTAIDKEKIRARMPQDKPMVWYDLNVNVLGYFIFASLLGLPESSWESLLKFEHTVGGAVAPVQKGEAQAVFLLRPPRVEMLEKMGAVNERMPQKSTYFYPKLASGLVFYSHLD